MTNVVRTGCGAGVEGASNANICAGEEREGSGQGCGSQQGEPPEEDPTS